MEYAKINHEIHEMHENSDHTERTGAAIAELIDKAESYKLMGACFEV
jgi:hypothetical protein